jgi:hypothetical protein
MPTLPVIGCCRSWARPRTPWPSTSSPFPPTRTAYACLDLLFFLFLFFFYFTIVFKCPFIVDRSPSLASTRPTCSRSGIGWAAATPSGRPSACPSPPTSVSTSEGGGVRSLRCLTPASGLLLYPRGRELRGAAHRCPRDGRALPHGTHRAQPAHHARRPRRMVRAIRYFIILIS